MKKQPFIQYTNLDSVTIECPCGETIIGEGDEITKFQRAHKKHTNGKCNNQITDDGMRCLSEDTKRNYTYKIG